MLLQVAPSPIARLNHAIVLRYVVGVEAALAHVEVLRGNLDGYHLFHAVRADLLHALGQHDLAQTAERRALALTRNRAEQSLLRHRLENAC
jgi:RNA polymerase sigma-70 factor (ECF subfamily)